MEPLPSHEEVMKAFEAPADGETLRVLLATDNHLGFMEEDSVRGNDSFETFEEILKIGRDGHVDCVILGGDLFHKNRPSRSTMSKTIALLRKYCLGPRDVDIRVRGAFRSSVANFDDENYAVDMPVFIIHGNHDDPTFDGGDFNETSSPIDILSEAGLVNYFGKQEERDSVIIKPVLIEKGDYTKLKLYGLGWIRDDRMHRLFRDDKVAFARKFKESENMDDDDVQDEYQGTGNGAEAKCTNADDVDRAWFEMMVVHQNRAHKGRGSKNCFDESMIPGFMDLVMFGHEHECIIQPQSAIDDMARYSLIQPGSSVRTMLTEGEAVPKQIGILELKLDKDDLEYISHVQPIPLRTVRPFALKEITLSSIDSVQPDLNDRLNDDEIASNITKILTEEVRALIDAVKEDYAQLRPDLNRKQRKAILPLIRLRVEHTGYRPINTQVFAQDYLMQVANAADMVVFYKARKARTKGDDARRKNGTGDNSEALGELDAQLRAVEELPATARINALVDQVLQQQTEDLRVIPKTEFNIRIREFVEKSEPRLIDMYIDDLLDESKHVLLRQQANADLDAEMDEEETERMMQKNVDKRNQRAKRKDDEARAVERAVIDKQKEQSQARKLRNGNSSSEEDDDMLMRQDNASDEDDEEEEHIYGRGRKKANREAQATKGRGKAKRPTRSSRAARKRKLEPIPQTDESEQEQDDDVEEISDVEEEEEEEENPRPKRPARGAAKRGAVKRKQNMAYESERERDDKDEEEDNGVRRVSPPPRKRGRRSTKSETVDLLSDDSAPSTSKSESRSSKQRATKKSFGRPRGRKKAPVFEE